MSRGLKTKAQSAPVIDMTMQGELMPVPVGDLRERVTSEARATIAALVTAIEREDAVIAKANGVKSARYKEAKDKGIDPNALRMAIRWRKNPQEYDSRNWQAAILRAVIDDELGTKAAIKNEPRAPRARVLPSGGDL